MIQVGLGELKVVAERQGADRIDVRLTGKSSSRDAGRELLPVFEKLMAAASEEHRTLVLHFEKLEYFNSSTIAALVQFIRTAHQQGVALIVRYDAALKWQAMSFEALSRALRPFEVQGKAGLQFLGTAE